MPICVVCDRSREHRGHSVLPLEEAVEGFKVRSGCAEKDGWPGRGAASRRREERAEEASFFFRLENG